MLKNTNLGLGKTNIITINKNNYCHDWGDFFNGGNSLLGEYKWN